MKVMKIAQVPPPAVQIGATIKEAIPAMVSQYGCAVAVLDGNRLAGTLSRDDVMQRLLAEGLNAETTTVAEVMNAPAETVTTETDTDAALRLMFETKKCYLGIVDEKGSLKGWLAICSLFQNHVDDLRRELDSLASYLSADGPGG